MKVGITTFGGDGGKSGISQYIINLLREFSTLDNEMEFEVIVYEDEKDLFVPDPDCMNTLSFGDSLRSPLANIAWHQVSLPKLVRKRGYDVLFLPAGNRRVPYSVPCPTVGTVHDFSSIHVEGKYDSSRMFYIKKVLPFLVRRLTRVLTVSESSKKDIVEFARVPEPLVTVTHIAADYNVYFPRDKSETIKEICPKYGIQAPYILYISRIEHPGKNHARLIKAFDLLKKSTGIPHQLVLAGSDWDRAEEVHRVANESPYSKEVIFTGFAPGEDIPSLYCGADLFVFPSLYEGFGMPVLEAMACGIPVACSDISSIPEVIGDTGVLFDPYQVESIAGAMAELLKNPDRMEDCRARGLERAKKFTWSATAALTLKIIREAAETGI